MTSPVWPLRVWGAPGGTRVGSYLEGSGDLRSGVSDTGYPWDGPKGQEGRYMGYGDLQEVGPGTMPRRVILRGPKWVILGSYLDQFRVSGDPELMDLRGPDILMGNHQLGIWGFEGSKMGPKWGILGSK